MANMMLIWKQRGWVDSKSIWLSRMLTVLIEHIHRLASGQITHLLSAQISSLHLWMIQYNILASRDLILVLVDFRLISYSIWTCGTFFAFADFACSSLWFPSLKVWSHLEIFFITMHYTLRSMWET